MIIFLIVLYMVSLPSVAIKIEEDSGSDEYTSVESVRTSRRSQKIYDLLTEWRNKATAASWMHDKSRAHFKFMNYSMMIPIIVLSTVTGAVQLTGASAPECAEDTIEVGGTRINVLQVVLGFMSISAAVMTGIYNFIKIGDLQAAHSFASFDFEKLAREIQTEVQLDDASDPTYASKGTLLREIQDKYDRISERAPSIPGRIEAMYTKHKRSSLSMSTVA